VDVAVLDLMSAPIARRPFDVQVDRPRADGAAARQRDLRLAEAASSGPSTRIDARMVFTSS
jgi:hypothetical protein